MIGSRTSAYGEDRVVRLAYCCGSKIAADPDDATPEVFSAKLNRRKERSIRERGGRPGGGGHLSDAATRRENDTKKADQTNADPPKQSARNIAMNSNPGRKDGGHCTPSKRDRCYACTLTVVLNRR